MQMRVTMALLYSFSSCSKVATTPPPWLNIRCLPTMPLELARPCAAAGVAEFSSSRGVSPPFAHTTTARAFCSCSRFSLS